TALSQYPNTVAGTFTVSGDGDDVLELLGTGNDDAFTQPSATRFAVNGRNINFTAAAGTPSVSTVKLIGLDGDDNFSVNLATLDITVTNVIVEAGQPTASDELNLTVTANGTVSQGADSTSGVALDEADGQEV